MLYQKENSIGQNHFECIRYNDFYYVPHMHRHPELILVREGCINVECDGKVEQVNAGEYALILPNRLHAYNTVGSSIVDVCIFSGDCVPLFMKQIHSKDADRSKFTCRQSISQFAEKELFIPLNTPNTYMLKSLLYAVLSEFISQAVLFDSKSKNDILFNKIIEYIDENYTEDITLASTAKALGYEQCYISKYFHKRIHMQFSRYVSWIRVDAATDLLLNTDLPITEIAMQSGFQSIRSFNRVYAQLTGTTPSSTRAKREG